MEQLRGYMSFLILIVLVKSNEGGLLQGPTDLLQPVGTDAVFSCRATVNATIEWRIDARGQDGLFFVSMSKVTLTNFGITKRESNLTNYSEVQVEGSLLNNNTKLLCRVFFNVDDMQQIHTSDAAYLQLYGPPDPPVNIKLTPSSPLSLLISWDPPFTPFTTQVTFTYTLFVMNQDGGMIQTVYNISSNTTSYLYTGDQSDVCRNISVSLLSVNDAGEGPVSDTVTETLPQVPRPISELSVDVELNESSIARLILSFKAPLVQCVDYPVLNYIVTLVDNSNDTVDTSTIDDYTSNRDTVEIVLEEGIEPDRIYTLRVAAVNEVGASNESQEMEIKTTDLRSVQLTYMSKGMVEVTCLFNKGTTAKGCYIIVVLATPTFEVLFNDTIHRNHDDLTATKSYSGHDLEDVTVLEVVGYDYESDHTRGDIAVGGVIERIPQETSTIGYTRTSSASIAMTTRPHPSTTLTLPIPTDVGSSSSSSVNSSLIIITVSAVGGLIVLAILVTVIIIVIQRCSRRRKQNKDYDDSSPVEVASIGDYTAISYSGATANSDSIKNIYKSNDTIDSLSSISKSRALSVCSGSPSHSKIAVNLVQPYGVTTLHPSAARPQEHLYQSVNEITKTPLGPLNSTAPLIPSSYSSSDSNSSTPPPVPPYQTRPSSHLPSVSPQPFYHVLEHNSSQECPPPPPLYDQVTPERSQTSNSFSSNTYAEPSPRTTPISTTPISTTPISTTPIPKKEHVYHELEQSHESSKGDLTISQSSHLELLTSQTTLSTVCGSRDVYNQFQDVFEEDTDGINPLGGPYHLPFGAVHGNYGRQNTVDQARLKSRSLPMGARLATRGRCNSEPDNHVLGIEPYNTLEKRMRGSYTLKRTLV